MSQIKRKSKESSSKKVRRGIKPLPTSGVVVGDLVASWSKEISELRKQKFNSVDEALQLIVERVIERMSLSEKEGVKVRAFLLLLIQNDPSLQEELRKNIIL